MASETSVVQVATAAADAKQQQKSAKKVRKTSATKTGGAKKTSADHPKYSEMVHQALANLKERGGSSRQAILKYIVKNFNVGKDENVVNTHVKMALKAGVKNFSLKQAKGSGASGSFRIGAEPAKKKPANKSTPQQKKTKKSSTKQQSKTSKPKKSSSGASGSLQKKVGTAKKTVAAEKKREKSTVKKTKKVVKKTKVSPVKKNPTVKKAKTSGKKPTVKKA